MYSLKGLQITMFLPRVHVYFKKKVVHSRSEIASTGLTITAPEEAGKWSLWALTVSSSGLRFSAPVQVQVFRPLQVEFHLPPSLRVRETLEVDIKIGNNINSCMDVRIYLYSKFYHINLVFQRFLRNLFFSRNSFEEISRMCNIVTDFPRFFYLLVL